MLRPNLLNHKLREKRFVKLYDSYKEKEIEELEKLKARAKILLEKAGGPEKFFKNSDSALKDILS